MALHSPDHRNLVLSVRLGITDRASVEFKDASEIPGVAFDAVVAYRTELLLKNLAYCQACVRERSCGGDIVIVFACVKARFGRDTQPAGRRSVTPDPWSV